MDSSIAANNTTAWFVICCSLLEIYQVSIWDGMNSSWLHFELEITKTLCPTDQYMRG